MDTLEFEVNGRTVSVADDGASLLEVLRDRLGVRSPKDGCSPQGQCGCCTVLVDGKPRVSCVTPARRVRGRQISTVEGLPERTRTAWAEAFCATGGSQCGFCTPGIILRLEALRRDEVQPEHRATIEQSLLAHLCRCTGWQTIFEAYARFGVDASSMPPRDFERAAQRAALEGGAPQQVGPQVPLGEAGFADDTAPLDALVALRSAAGDWVVAETLTEARALAGKVQGRHSTIELRHPITFPDGAWDARLRTAWVEPAYLETDASWCAPGGEPATPLANGGAFGGKRTSEVEVVARRLADEHGRAVRVLYAREDTVWLGPKRPPLAGGANRDGSGRVRVARTLGIARAIWSVAPRFEIEEVDIPGPPTSAAMRAAGWAEAVALLASARWAQPLKAPNGAFAVAEVKSTGVHVRVECGDPLDEIVLRSYCIGAAHMALSWVWSEALTVDGAGDVHDLTIRSFGILRAQDMPPVTVEIERSADAPVNGSDAVFAAVAAAATVAEGRPEQWPCR